MKTTFSTLISSLSLVALLSTSAFAGVKNNNNATVVAEAKSFNKIEVRGNVEVYLTDGATNNVTAFNNYYGESALVQNQNGVLRISSYSSNKLVVYVTVAELSGISAYDNSVVKSYNGLSAIELNVNLYDNATAQLNLEGYNANFNVYDRAKADLKGNITNVDLKMNQASTVNASNLKAEQLSKVVLNNKRSAKATEEIAVI